MTGKTFRDHVNEVAVQGRKTSSQLRAEYDLRWIGTYGVRLDQWIDAVQHETEKEEQ